ncbi:peptidase C39 [Kineobactrum sediminis]|uniref:Peptidase C39 n=2 Tax=Kineobactrum sediminis TaxID=1905677 RepID=A0A2N5Y0G9_9GAMM|nr:peptidase C39 [Kineobactrum sediminis]
MISTLLRVTSTAAVLATATFQAFALDLNNTSMGGNFSVPVTSFAERKFETIYRQQYDFSCGSAALASLLTFHYQDTVSEIDVFLDMFEHGDQEKIQHQGFSMLDMKHYLERRGYSANGFKVSLDRLNIPAITIINQNGYLHFVIVKGLSPTEVLVGDPSVGVKRLEKKKFNEMWESRILFLVENKATVGAASYQRESEWALNPRSPVANALDRSSLAEFNLLRRNYDDL